MVVRMLGRLSIPSAESVAGAFEGEYVGVVDDAVDHRGGDCLISEHAAPAGERQVRGEDQ